MSIKNSFESITKTSQKGTQMNVKRFKNVSVHLELWVYPQILPESRCTEHDFSCVYESIFSDFVPSTRFSENASFSFRFLIYVLECISLRVVVLRVLIFVLYFFLLLFHLKLIKKFVIFYDNYLKFHMKCKCIRCKFITNYFKS